MGWKSIENKRAYEREYMQALRDLLRGLGLCVECAKEDAYTMAGRRLCAECAEKQRKRAKEHRERHKDEVQDRQKALRESRIERHECTECGKVLGSGYRYKTCEFCRAKRREYRLRSRRAAGVLSKDAYRELGLCVRCGAPRMEGFTAWGGEPIKLCEKCYRDTCASGVIGREAAERKLGTTWGNYQYEHERMIRHGQARADT